MLGRWLIIILALESLVFFFLWPSGIWELLVLLAFALAALAPALFQHCRSLSTTHLSTAFLEYFVYPFIFFLPALVISSYTILSPTYIVWGDELAFYTMASSLADSWPSIPSIAGIGVYDTHPVGWSIYQAMFLKIAGDSFWACRLASMFWHYLGIFPLFWLVRTQWGLPAAVVSATIFSTSFYGFQFSHFSYNNIAFLTPLLFALYCVHRGVVRKSPFFLLMAGLWSSLGFYLNYISLLTPLLVWIFLALTAHEMKKAKYNNNPILGLSFMFLCGVLIGGLPFLFHLEAHFLKALMHFNFSDNPAQHQFAFSILTPFPERLQNFFAALGAPIFFRAHSHHVEGSLFDGVSAALGTLGACMLLARLVKKRFSEAFYLIAVLIYCFFLGYLSPYQEPSITRLLFWIPSIAILAGVAINAVLYRVRPSIKSSAIITVVLATLFLNWQKIAVYHEASATRYHSLTQLVQLLQQTEETYLFVSTQNPDSGDIYWLETVYGLTNRMLPFSASLTFAELEAVLMEESLEGMVVVTDSSTSNQSLYREINERFRGRSFFLPSEENPLFRVYRPTPAFPLKDNRIEPLKSPVLN